MSGDIPNGHPSPIISGRYAIEEVLGRGGMATVFRVRDQVSDRVLALKQLQCDQERLRDKVTRLFQQEYQTLAELAHPRIVRVDTYGLDDGIPYYTMELLDGGDLNRVAPLPWREACALLRDVASALAMVHSRRLVHRDVTPRNVRRTADGRAKLIDFGALSPMGEPVTIIGTPPFMPPEMIHRQPLDGRSDLYSLGALAYWLLTEQHAYLVRNMSELRDRWRQKLAPPSSIAADVPQNLNALVMSLLSLDVLGRPMTAWEVIDRLSAIAELAPDEELGEARAYLVTPTLVGRDRERAEMRAKLAQALQGRGAVVWVRGATGSGRSRLLASFALDARLLGVPVLRADGADTRAGDLAVVRAFATELETSTTGPQTAVPDEVQAVLRLAEEPIAKDERQRQLVEGRKTLVHWLLDLAKERGLLLSVDDVQRVDHASAAVLGELVQAAPRHKVVIALTVCSDDDAGTASLWTNMLQQSSPAIQPEPLTEEQTEALMRSIFGDAAHLRTLAYLIHGLAAGNPRTCMTLAQHLLDRGLVRYESGRWILPADPHALGLSENVRDAMSARLSSLRPEARELAEALAVVDPMAPVASQQYEQLVRSEVQPHVFSALVELTAHDILRSRGDGHVFTHPTLVETLRSGMSASRARELHKRLARVYEREDASDIFMIAWHLQQADEHAEASRLLIEHARAVNAPSPSLRSPAPRVGYYRLAHSAYQAALEYCERAEAPRRALFELRRALVYLSPYYDPRLASHAVPLIEQLQKDTGLCHYSQLDITDPMARVLKCLTLAKERYDATPEAERCMDPGEAIAALAHLVSVLAGTYSRVLDFESLATLPSLIDPLRPLAPALDIVAEIVRSSCDAGFGLESFESCNALMARILDDPALRDNPIMLAIVHAVRYYLGAWEARLGGERGIARAESMEHDIKDWEQRFPYHVGLGRYRSWQVRRLTYLYNGDLARAKLCRERIELLQLDGMDPLVTPNLQTGIYMEARAHAAIGSLPDLKDAIDVIQELADTSPTWLPVLHWIRGEYHRVREDFRSARCELEKAIENLAPGRHMVWGWGMASLAEVLICSGEPQRAHEIAVSAARQCEGVALQPLMLYEFERVLALAEAQLGDTVGAVQRLEALIAKTQSELGGVPLGRIYEARAQVALLMADAGAFERYAELTAECFRAGGHPALVARHEKLLEQARQRGIDSRTVEASSSVRPRSPSALDHALHTLQTIMAECRPDERAARALQILVEQSGATHGYLFGAQRGGVRLMASSTADLPAPELLCNLRQLVQGEQSEFTRVIAAPHGTAAADDRITLAGGTVYFPVILRSTQREQDVIACVAALCMNPPRPVRLHWRLTSAIGDYLLDSVDVLSLVATT